MRQFERFGSSRAVVVCCSGGVRYQLDPLASTATVHARSTLHPLHSSTAVTGWVDLELRDDGYVDLDAPVDGEIEVDLRQMRSGNALVDREAERRLKVGEHPTMQGHLTSLVPAAVESSHGHRYDGDGVLTFNGVTRPLAGGLSIVVDDDVLEITGDTALDVTDYDVQPPSLLVIKVHAEVRIELHAIARRVTP